MSRSGMPDAMRMVAPGKVRLPGTVSRRLSLVGNAREHPKGRTCSRAGCLPVLAAKWTRESVPKGVRSGAEGCGGAPTGGVPVCRKRRRIHETFRLADYPGQGSGPYFSAEMPYTTALGSNCGMKDNGKKEKGYGDQEYGRLARFVQAEYAHP